MPQLMKGANAPVTGDVVSMTVVGVNQGAVDLMAFQVTGERRVRSDEDFVFFNQPQSPEGAVRLVPPDQLEIELPRVPAEIDRITVAVALDESVPGGLGDVQLGATITSTAGPIAVRAEGLTSERAAVLLEFYRRDGGWKVRFVCAGWAAGFAALVREHGVDVEDSAPAAAPAAPLEPLAPPTSIAPPTQPMPPAPPVPPAPPAPAAPPAAPTAVAPPAPQAAPPATQATPAAPPAPAGTIDLGKRTGTINLTKGQRVSIDKTEQITASIYWPPATDYDVYALVLYTDGHVETVSTFGTRANKQFSLTTADGAVRHAGDVGRSAGARPARGGGLFGRKAAPTEQAPMATERIDIRPHAGIRAVVPVAYSAQSNGTGSFRRYQVSMVIDNGQGTSVRVDAANADSNDKIYTCVPGIVLVTPDGVTIDYLESYSKPGSENRPIIGPDLRVVMDAGEVNAYK